MALGDSSEFIESMDSDDAVHEKWRHEDALSVSSTFTGSDADSDYDSDDSQNVRRKTSTRKVAWEQVPDRVPMKEALDLEKQVVNLSEECRHLDQDIRERSVLDDAQFGTANALMKENFDMRQKLQNFDDAFFDNLRMMKEEHARNLQEIEDMFEEKMELQSRLKVLEMEVEGTKYNYELTSYHGQRLVNQQSALSEKGMSKNLFHSPDAKPKQENIFSVLKSKPIVRKVTVPKPFTFDADAEDCSLNKSQNLVREEEREFDAQVTEAKEGPARQQFKANPIPKTTMMPLFEKIQEKKKKRSEEIKANSKAQLAAQEKPFSFQQREAAKAEKKRKAHAETAPKQFKANPVPLTCSLPMYEMLQKKEQLREARIVKRAQEKSQQAKLPPRMQLYALLEGSKGSKRKKKEPFMTPEHTFKPKKPGTKRLDVHKMQRIMQKKIEAGRKHQHTRPEEFKLETQKRLQEKLEKSMSDGGSVENLKHDPMEPRWPFTRASVLKAQEETLYKNIGTTAPDQEPKGTIGDKKRQEKTRQIVGERQLDKSLDEEKAKQAKAKSKLVTKMIAPLLMTSTAKEAARLKDKRSEKAKELRKNQKAWQEKVAKMSERKYPYLFQRKYDESCHKKVLDLLDDRLRARGEDPSQYVTDEMKREGKPQKGKKTNRSADKSYNSLESSDFNSSGVETSADHYSHEVGDSYDSRRISSSKHADTDSSDSDDLEV